MTANRSTLIEPEFDLDLLGRYDVTGPRYTSYPTAPQFSESFGESEYRQCAVVSNGDPIPRPISIYVHVPFCTSPCFYCGCTKIITRDRSKAEAYLSRLYREIELNAELFDRDRSVMQLHYGGGTPNFLSPNQLIELTDTLRRHFHFEASSQTEYSIELDPREADAHTIEVLAEAGFNRASLGIQDFDPIVQKAVNREQTPEQTFALLDACRAQGFRSVNVDLIYGLPKQNLAGFAKTLDLVIAAKPDRIAAYSYAHVPQLFKPQQQINADDLPDPQSKLALLELTIDKLCGAGYHYIGMDHFALPEDELVRAQRLGSLQRNFQGYSTHAECDLIGLGVSSIGKIGDSYSQNHKDIMAYYAALDAGHLPIARGVKLDDDDLLRRDIIQRLMCHAYLDIGDIEARYGIVFSDYFEHAMTRLQELASDGLVTFAGQQIAITRKGRLLMRVIAMAFDRYLQQPQGTLGKFSRVI